MAGIPTADPYAGPNPTWKHFTRVSMNSVLVFALLTLSGTTANGKVGAQEYNLRTLPSIPTAGTAFLAAFDSTDCEAWVLPPIGQAPSVTVRGQNVRLEVDRINIENCSFQPRTHTLNVPSLPSGRYQLELIARGFESPGNNIEAQTVGFQVSLPTASEARPIPVNAPAALAWLASITVLLGFAFTRRTPSASRSL